MIWTGPAALRAQVQKLWERGDLLASVVTGEPLFPRRLTLRGPSSQEMTDRFGEVRVWIGELRAMPHCRVEMREFRHHLFGTNAMPQEVWIDTLDYALAIVGKRREASRFGGLLEATRACQPELLAWLAKRPLRALELAEEWHRLLDIVGLSFSLADPKERLGAVVKQLRTHPALRRCALWIGGGGSTRISPLPPGVMQFSDLQTTVEAFRRFPRQSPRPTSRRPRLPIPDDLVT